MPDDFTLIRTINPKTAARLHEAGILTYEKLAAMTPEEIVSRIGLGSGITAESIAKKDWIGQAAKLAEPMRIKGEPESATALASNLHAVSYVMELFLDDRNTVSKTKIRHVQSEEEEEWSDWDETLLSEYFLRRPELSLPKTRQIASSKKPSQAIIKSDAPVSSPAQQAENTAATVSGTNSENETKRKEAPETTGKPRLHALEIIPEKIGVPCRAFAQNQPFSVRLNLDMTDLALGDDSSLNYSLTVQARSLTDRAYETVAKGTGVIMASSNALLELQAVPLSAGVYQFAAALTLNPQSTHVSPQQRQAATLFKGGLFEVY